MCQVCLVNNSYIADVVVGIIGTQKKMAFYDVVSINHCFIIQRESQEAWDMKL